MVFTHFIELAIEPLGLLSHMAEILIAGLDLQLQLIVFYLKVFVHTLKEHWLLAVIQN